MFLGFFQVSDRPPYLLALPSITLIAGIYTFLPWTRAWIGSRLPAVIAAAGIGAVPNIVYCLRQMPKSAYNSSANYQAYIRMELTGNMILLAAALLAAASLIMNRTATSVRLPTR
jgi:hypothetical protein